MFLLPRILFNVYWWARFDTLASSVDWFPIHTRPLFVTCLVAFASVLFGAIALIPLGGHSPQIQKKKKQAIFLSYQQNDGRLLYPASRVYISVVDSGEGHGGPGSPSYS